MKKITLKLALLAGSALVSSHALAQNQPTPPEHYTLDQRGVDLVSGAFIVASDEISIGSGSGAISNSRISLPGGWRDQEYGTVLVAGNEYIVSYKSKSVVFVKSGTSFSPKIQDGSTFHMPTPSTGVYRTPSGVTMDFESTDGGALGSAGTYLGLIKRTSEPNGSSTTFSWGFGWLCVFDGSGCLAHVPVWRIEKLENNYGNSIAFEYESNAIFNDSTSFLRRTRVVAYNSSVELCGSANNFCRSSVTKWPAINYSYTGSSSLPSSVSDQSGRVTRYTYSNNNLSSITYPGSTASHVSVSYNAAGRVSTASAASGTWNYAYADAGTTRTTTATGPLGQSLTVVSDQTIGRATSVTERVSTTPAVSRTMTYTYDAQRRLKRVTQPEGDYGELTYDARGNVTQTLHAPKPGSGLGNITTSAVYPGTCANPVTCNLPTATTDARGATTDYAYDPVHGGVTSVTAPAPTPGAARPQTRIAYAPQTAWYKNAAGVLAAAPSAVTLPVSTSSCVTGSSCVGTAQEVKTSIVYGAPGVANNLLPTAVTTGAGDGSLSATTAMTYTPNGDVATVDGPLAGTADTTTYRYDNARQLVGVVGPDPDGGGPLLRRAQRTAYNARGQATLSEAGTVNGLSDGDWAAFNSLQQASVVYDAYGRPTHQRQTAGGATHAVQQVSYDAAGRVECTATRMNPAAFHAPPASACDLGPGGIHGPDRIMKIGYDAAGQTTSTVSGWGVAPITESAAYSLNGKPISLTDGQGNVSTLTYDGFDRLARMNYPNATGGGTSSIDYEQYGYDAGGNVTTYRNRGGDTVSYAYDALGRVTLADASAADDVSYAYDNLGRTLSASGGGQTLNFTWDALGRRTSESGPQGAIWSGYDLAGRRTQLTWPDGFHVNYDYNTVGDLTAIRENGATNWQLASWAYDNLGRRIAQARANGVNTTWTYDAAGQLASVSHAGTTNQPLSVNLTYNPAGQIVSRTMSNPTYAYAPGAGAITYANNGKNQVTNVGGAAVGYDGRQNIANAPAMGSYGYDGLNRLTSANTAAGSMWTSYDPAGRLFQEVGGATYRFLYDGAQMVGEYDGAGNLQRRFIPGLGLDEHILTYEGAGLTDRRWMLQDERQSVVAYLNGSGATLSINTYDEYGQPGAGNAGRFQYTGQMWLPQAQVYHYRARAYAPQLGRFMQTDPIGYGDGANLYAYVGADPMNATDPWGLCTYRYVSVGGEGGIPKGGGWRMISSECLQDLQRILDSHNEFRDRVGSGGFIGRNPPPSDECASSYITVNVGVSATAFGYIVGANAGANAQVSIPLDWNLRGLQVSVSAQSGALFGGGLYAGGGLNVGGGYSSAPMTPGVSGFQFGQAEANLGWGPSVGGNAQLNLDSNGQPTGLSATRGVGGAKLGGGAGAMAGAGGGGGIMYASPTLRCSQ